MSEEGLQDLRCACQVGLQAARGTTRRDDEREAMESVQHGTQGHEESGP